MLFPGAVMIAAARPGFGSAALAAPARAHVVDEQQVRSRAVDLTIDSPASGTTKVRLLTRTALCRE